MGVNESTCLTKVKQTCNNISMIDYFLLSSPVFSLVKLFDILDFNPLFSDVHCGLCFNLYASVNNFTTHSLTIVVSRLRMPNGFTTKKTCLSIQ